MKLLQKKFSKVSQRLNSSMQHQPQPKFPFGVLLLLPFILYRNGMFFTTLAHNSFSFHPVILKYENNSIPHN
jgi:hypothetical protein